MNPKNKKKIAVVISLFIIVLTILRENLFLEINAILNGENVNRANFYVFYDAFISFSSKELTLIKYALTFLFILIISSLTFLAINYWFVSKIYNRITVYFLTGVISIFLIVLAFFKVFGGFIENYYVMRRTIGFLQSPIPLFILFTLFMYFDKQKEGQ